MCTYATYQCEVSGSGKSAVGWFSVTRATVYLDHPVHAFAEHTVNIDLAAPDHGPAARVAVELHPDSVLDFLTTVARAVLDVPADISGLGDTELKRLTQLVEGA